MSIEWGGPYASTTLPAGQRITGWSEYTTGAGTFKNRYRDGDALSAFAWREMYGNVNYHIATSRRPIWVESFNGIASTDPSKLYTGTDFTDLGAIYALSTNRILTPNPTRGDENPPQLSCRVRVKKNANATDAVVRIYSVPGGDPGPAVVGWPWIQANADSSSYVSWTYASTSYAWTDPATITRPLVSDKVYTYPVAGALDDKWVWETRLILACQGNADGSGLYVAQVEVFEETPGA